MQKRLKKQQGTNDKLRDVEEVHAIIEEVGVVEESIKRPGSLTNPLNPSIVNDFYNVPRSDPVPAPGTNSGLCATGSQMPRGQMFWRESIPGIGELDFVHCHKRYMSL